MTAVWIVLTGIAILVVWLLLATAVAFIIGRILGVLHDDDEEEK